MTNSNPFVMDGNFSLPGGSVHFLPKSHLSKTVFKLQEGNGKKSILPKGCSLDFDEGNAKKLAELIEATISCRVRLGAEIEKLPPLPDGLSLKEYLKIFEDIEERVKELAPSVRDCNSEKSYYSAKIYMRAYCLGQIDKLGRMFEKNLNNSQEHVLTKILYLTLISLKLDREVSQEYSYFVPA